MNTKLVLVIIMALVLGVGCAKAQSIALLKADDFEKKAASIEDKIILDVRTPEEYNESHLNKAILLDYYRTDFKNQVTKLDKTKPIFVYCKGGGRSTSSCEILKNLGFKEVYNLQGGITDWKKAGKSVVK